MNPPANWYPDPTGRHGQRYWDGEQWTEHVFTDGVQGVDPLDTTGAGEQQGASAAVDAATAGDAGAAEAERGDTAPESAGLFADAGDAPADQAPAEDAPAEDAPAEQEGTWEPADEARDEGQDEEAVAAEVETEDVVGTLDEVSESDGTTVAAATVSPAPEAASAEGTEPADHQEPTDGHEPTHDQESAEGATPAGDFSDAFMVTPETVSRLVSRQASTAPQPAEDEPLEEAAPTPEPEPAAAAAAPVEAAPPPESEDDAAATTGGVIDAPPPSIPQRQPDAEAPPTESGPAAAADGGLGITGELVGGAFAEREQAGPVALQNSRLLRCSLADGSAVIARQGTMVAYQGEVDFERQGAGGVTRALKRAATGEGLAMMRAEGSGDVFFADGAQHVFLLHLEGGPGLSVNGRNVLAFSADLQWDIERVKGATLLAGGLFNTSLTGTGWVALVSDGEPVVLRTDEAATHVDVNALVAWSGGLDTRITNTVSAKSLVGLGSGEAFQMAFEGRGIVVVQPSEGATGGAAAT